MDGMTNLPGYEFLEKIGEGGMASVWTARQISLERVVAIKMLSPKWIGDAGAVERFRQEALSAARLKHPGIVQVYDAGEHDGSLYIVMEFVAGCTVAELMHRKGRLSEKHALLIAEGVALALQYAWEEARIIHCDVKPDNVMLEQDGTVKLADLGLAKFMGGVASGSPGDVIEGTPHYTSPEQVRGEADLDCRADIYSLGAMLYHMTTGVLPFFGTPEEQVMEKQLHGYLSDPQEVNPLLSSGVAWLIEKLMVKDRTVRYASWAEVLGDTEQVRGGGIPVSQLPAVGQSTVLRSDFRSRSMPGPTQPATEVPSGEQPAVGKPVTETKPPPPAAPPKQKIVLPKDLRNQIRAASGKSTSDLARAVVTLILLSFAVVLAYGALTYLNYLRSRAAEKAEESYWEEKVPPRSQVQVTMPQPHGSEGETAKQAVSVPVRPAHPEDAATKAQWDDPTFIKGARLFNDALDKYKKFSADKQGQNPAVLETVERESREAIAAFESVRSRAPADIKLPELITQCYRLISDCRQSTLVSSARAGVGPAPAAPAAPAAPMPAKARNGDNLVLAASWNSGPQVGGEKILKNLADLLAGQGQPNVDVKPDPTLMIYEQIGYLMPLKDALALLGQNPTPKKPVLCPGFPKDSLYYVSIDGAFDSQFNKMLLVTDASDRIVAVELVNEHPDQSLWLEPQLFLDKWHAYNFIQGRTKGSSKWRVAHRTQTLGRVLRIDSELVANDEYGYFGLGDSKERVALFLPEPIVNLILFRIGKASTGPG